MAARATSEALPPVTAESGETGGAADDEKPEKGGRFSRKGKKKAAKKAAKKAKHSKEKEPRETSTDGAGPSPADILSDDHDPDGGGTRGEGPGPGEEDGSPAQPPRVPAEADAARGASAVGDRVRRDSGIGDAPSGATTRRSTRDHEEEGGAGGGRGARRGDRSQSGSRSGSRKRFGLFRKRARSSARDDRSKSETDLPGVVVRKDEDDPTGVEGLPGEMKKKGGYRDANSLDRGKGRLAAVSSGRGDGDTLHAPVRPRPHSASLERDAYRRYDPATAPRTRLQHMTVKDAVNEYRHRRQTSATRVSSADRRTAEVDRGGASSNDDVSRSVDGGRGGGDEGPEDAGYPRPHAYTDQEVSGGSSLLSSATGTVRETSLLGASSDRLHEDGDHQHGEGSPSGRRNLGEQIQDMCRTFNRDDDAVGGVVHGGGSEAEAGDSRTRGEVCEDNRGGSLPRNTSSVIFINPNDIVTEPADVSPPLHPESSLEKPTSQPVVKPSNLFMELRRAVPLYSNSTAARERRISQSDESPSLVSRDSRTNQSRDSLIPRDAPPRGVSPASVSSAPTTTTTTSSKGASSGVPLHNIPAPGGLTDLTAASSSSPSSAASPTITVNYDEGAGMSDSMDTSLTMTTSMISSTDSGKRSSDQGFISEPRDSDTESESGDMSGFSTPPEEPDDRGSVSPAVFVNTVSNLLEVPSSKSPHGGSGGSRKAESGASPFSRSESSKSDSVLLKQRGKRPPSPSSLAGGVLYQQTKQELRPSSGDDAEQQTLQDSMDQQALQDRMDQKTVPVMGTSVQHKYRRTFSPVRTKGGEATPEPAKDSTVPPSEATADRSQQPEVLPPPDDAQRKSAPNEGNKQAGKGVKQGEETVQRGRDTKKRRGFISGRSFRRKNEKENQEPAEVPATERADAQTAEAPAQGSERRSADTDPEELRHRKAFQDKSIQTSESLLMDLIKKTKKRKPGLFSPDRRKSKQPRTTAQYPSTPISEPPPPPSYEEERPLCREAPTEASSAVAGHDVPSASGLDQADGVEERDAHDVVQAAPAVPDIGEPAGEGDQQVPEEGNNGEAKKSARKTKGPSLLAIVALKQKLARNRKKKEEQRKREEEERQPQDDLPSDTLITIENELNLSKLAEIKETDILDDDFFEPELCPALPLKKLRFEPIASDEPIQSEEPLPPLSPASRRISARRNSTRGRERRKKCLQYIKKFVAFLFSHIGLCSLVVGYTIVGGLMFRELERHHEKQIKADVKSERLKLMDRIVSLATGFQLNELSEKNMTDVLGDALIDYQIFLHRETASNGWDGNEIDPNSTAHDQWSFASSMLYAITVMTTIGYGHVTPKTSQGRLVTIGYAVLGIPLTLLCLTNIGDVMASGFRLLYGKVCCGVCCKLFKPSRRRRRRGPRDVEAGLARQEQGETDKPKEVIQVPTSLCLLLIASYIFAGSLLFVFWEGWDFVTGSYFCFITLSTIGFGDIVPGMDLNTWSKESKLALSGLYLVFGLSLIAMCFNLVQEDVKAKCRWLGMKIGIIEKPEPPV